MKRIILTLLTALVLNACAGVPARMAEDQGSAAKVDLLRDRAKAFWAATVIEDYEKVYSLYDPFFRAASSKTAFIATRGTVKYHSFEIKDVKVDGNVGRVTVSVVYSIPKVVFKRQEFSKPDTPAEFEETWLFVEDNWYKEFKLDDASGSGSGRY